MRFIVFDLQESPKYLVAKGRDQEAIAVFPAPHRGTGDALASSFNRVMGILSPVIKIATTTATGAAAPGSSPNA
ncbi:hypothetical protein C0989_001192 [Termitomyces sp. Mn162]|nr:hypothetical protein C0989_001192 [Termitomyces sp. Mn162]